MLKSLGIYREKEKVIKQLTAEGTITDNLMHAFPQREDAVIFFTTCAIDGEIEAVDAFIRCGVDIDGLVQDDYTAVHLAAQEGHLEVVKLLVSKGANIHIETHDRGRYAFYSACLHGHLPVVEFLRPLLTNVDKKIKSGVTPLNATCGNGNLEVVKFLVSSGADVNSADNDGVTPMRVACWEGYLDIVKYLREAGADINRSANDESTPLSAAAYNGRISIVMYLNEMGAVMDKRDDDGMTALYAASCNGHLDVVRYLLECGADMSIPDNAGVTAAEVALANGHQDVSRYLLGRNGSISSSNRMNGFGDLEIRSTAGSTMDNNDVTSLKSELKDLKKELLSMQKWYYISLIVLVAVAAFFIGGMYNEPATRPPPELVATAKPPFSTEKMDMDISKPSAASVKAKVQKKTKASKESRVFNNFDQL